MSTESTTSEYMLLFRNTSWHRALSPQELQKVTDQWMAWYDRLAEQGKVTAGHPLMHEGKIVSGKNGRFVADGPFAESKEAIGGYFLLHVETVEEALTIAKDCPGLEYGTTVEVRPVAAVCPMRESSAEAAYGEGAEATYAQANA
jgi:hypothetical protein